jgi:hypothetical protein
MLTIRSCRVSGTDPALAGEIAMKRREVLKQLGAGSAAILAVPGIPGMPLLNMSAPLAGLTDLAQRFRAVHRTKILETVALAIKAGADYRSILGASFLAGIHDVRPRHVGGKLHCVMMIEAAFQMCEALPEKEALLLALWSVDDFKRSQAIDRSDNDWVLPPRPEVSFSSEAAARKEFLSAMEAWDDQKADRAIVGLIPFHDLDSIYELLWKPSARSFGAIGHKIIYGAQLHRVIRRIGWQHAEPVLRSLIHGILHIDSSGKQTDVYQRTVKGAAALPDGWLKGKEDAAASGEILRKFRKATSDEGRQIVIDAFKSGLGSRTVWDGMRLAASEIFARRFPAPPNTGRSLLPVHAVTEINAFHHAWRSSNVDSTKRIMILQAAGWLPDLREAMKSRGHYDKNGPALDSFIAPKDEKVPGLDGVFEARQAELVKERLEREPKSIPLYKDRMRKFMASKAVEHHQHKYAGAFIEESELVAPRWASAILAPAISYLPTAVIPETGVAKRSLKALKKAGVI